MVRAALKNFFQQQFFGCSFPFLASSFLLPSLCLCVSVLSVWCCVSVSVLSVCVCVCVCWCWVGLKRKQTFFLCWVGITIFPMVLSHPSGTLEKKVKRLKKKGKKKEKKKKKMPLGAK